MLAWRSCCHRQVVGDGRGEDTGDVEAGNLRDAQEFLYGEPVTCETLLVGAAGDSETVTYRRLGDSAEVDAVEDALTQFGGCLGCGHEPTVSGQTTTCQLINDTAGIHFELACSASTT